MGHSVLPIRRFFLYRLLRRCRGRNTKGSIRHSVSPSFKAFVIRPFQSHKNRNMEELLKQKLQDLLMLGKELRKTAIGSSFEVEQLKQDICFHTQPAIKVKHGLNVHFWDGLRSTLRINQLSEDPFNKARRRPIDQR